jgi:hypothetical protein
VDKRKGYVLLLINTGVRNSESERTNISKVGKKKQLSIRLHKKKSAVLPSSNNKTLNATEFLTPVFINNKT